MYHSIGAMSGALTFAVRDMNRVGMTATAADGSRAEDAKPQRVSSSDLNLRCSDQQRSAKTPGRWLSFGLSALDRFSENGVGRTGFEPVTSSVSVQGSCLLAVVDLAMDGSGGRPG